MKIARANTEAEYVEKASKFISLLYKVESPAQHHAILNELRKIHPKANHVCNAYRIFQHEIVEEKASDDGEPRYSAGTPILNQIKSNDLVQTSVFVVRYFGGVKLGVGGLLKSYKKATQLCIEKAELEEYIAQTVLKLSFSYSETATVEKMLRKLDTKVINQRFESKVKCEVSVPTQTLESAKTALNPYLI